MLLHNIVSIYLVITTTTTDSTAHRTRHGLSEVELKFLRQISTQRYDSSSARNSTNDNYGIVGDFTGGTDFYSELDRRGTKNEVRHGAKRKGHRAMEKLHVIENGYLVEKEPSYAHEGNPELEHLAQPEVSSKRRRQLHKPVIDSGYDVQQQTQFNRRVEEIIDRQQNHENDHKSITEIQQSKRSRGLRSAPEAVDAKPKAGFAASHQRLALSSAALSSVDKLKKEFKTTEKSTEGAESVVGQSLKFVDAPDKSSTGVVAFSSKAVAASKPKKPSPPAQIVADALKPPPGCNNDSDFLVQQMLRKHDRRKVPKTKDGGGVTVTVELWVQEISSIIEINSEFELDLYVTEQWKDPSLSFDEFNPCKKNLSLDADAMIRQIWTPNSCFVNSKNASIHRSPYRNIFLMIYDSGVVWLNYRTKIIGPCAKENKSFPIDNQRCSLTYESYNHNSDDVVMRWLQPNPVLILGSINLPDYELVNFSYIHVEKNYPPGKWDELTVTFVFQRLYGFYILQAYVPAYLIIFLSWVSFYLGSKSIPSRTTVCVNCFLALAFQFGSIMQTLPRTNAVRSIHVWILSCMGFIFCSLLELAIIGYMAWNDQMGTGLDCSCPLLCFECPVLTAIRIDAISMTGLDCSCPLLCFECPVLTAIRIDAISMTGLDCSCPLLCFECPVLTAIRIDAISMTGLDCSCPLLCFECPVLTAIRIDAISMTGLDCSCPLLCFECPVLTAIRIDAISMTGLDCSCPLLCFECPMLTAIRIDAISMTGLDCSCPLLCFECPMLTAIRIDAISMVAFPASFVIFNIYYWGIYIT